MDGDRETGAFAEPNYLWCAIWRTIDRRNPSPKSFRTFRLVRQLSRHMRKSDLLKLILSPFSRRKMNREPEMPERMIEAGLKAPIREAAGSA